MYVTNSVIGTTYSVNETDAWAAQYSVALLWDCLLFQGIVVVIKYKIQEELLNS